MQYDISEVCELFGLTPGSIRHYEKMGLIHPVRTGGNRRKYTEKDLLTLTRVRMFRFFDFGLGEMERYFREDAEGTASDAAAVLLEKQRTIEHEIERLEHVRIQLARYRSLMEEGQKTFRLEPAKMPAFYRLRFDRLFGKAGPERSALSAWLHCIPEVRPVEGYEVRDQEISRQVFFITGQDTAEHYHLPLPDHAVLKPEAQALRTVVKVPGQGSFGMSDEQIRPLIDSSRRFLGPVPLVIYSAFLMRLTENGQSQRYFDLWIRPD